MILPWLFQLKEMDLVFIGRLTGLLPLFFRRLHVGSFLGLPEVCYDGAEISARCAVAREPTRQSERVLSGIFGQNPVRMPHP